jgi:hypothetical protein
MISGLVFTSEYATYDGKNGESKMEKEMRELEKILKEEEEEASLNSQRGALHVILVNGENYKFKEMALHN